MWTRHYYYRLVLVGSVVAVLHIAAAAEKHCLRRLGRVGLAEAAVTTAPE